MSKFKYRRGQNVTEEPWGDHHGLHLGAKMTTNALGWALLRPRNTKIVEEGRDRLGKRSHEDAILDKWQTAGRPENVTMYKYANYDAFFHSPDKGGLTLAEHSDLVDRAARKLRRHGANVTIEIVEYL